MKKQLNQTHILLLVIMILSAAVYMVGCKKSTTSPIVGTWMPSTGTTVTKVSGTTVSDTSYTLTPSATNFSSVTFSSNGQYSEIVYPGGADSTGAYTYSGGLLTFTSGVSLSGKGYPASISGNQLSVTVNIDTTIVSPLTVQTTTYILTN